MISLNIYSLKKIVSGFRTQTVFMNRKIRTLAMALLLISGSYNVSSAQCISCALADINPDPTEDLVRFCASEIGDPEDYLIINPACPTGVITFADVTVTAGTGINGSPYIFDRTYTYNPGGGGALETCTQRILLESSADALDFVDCPQNMFFTLGPNGLCQQNVSFAVTAVGACAEVVQTQGLPSGSEFPVGTTVQEFEATDLTGETITCTFEVTVNPYAGDVDNVSCIEGPNVGVDENCQVIITPSLALSGNISCADDYTIMVSGLTEVIPGSITGNGTSEVTIDANGIEDFDENGMTDFFEVAVSSANGGCWNGEWMLEDKIAPEICCTDFSINCISQANTTPEGNYIQGGRVWNGTGFPYATLDPTLDVPFGVLEVPLEVDACENINLSSISVFVGIDHDQMGDITVQLISPSGTTALIFDRPGFPASADGCTDVNVANWFTNGGGQPHTVLEDDCTTDFGNEETSYIAAASPITTIFSGEAIAGTWILRVIDANENGITGTVENVRLSISGNYGEPLVTENCKDITPTYTDVLSQEACSPFQTITRTWTVSDAKQSATCVQTITVGRVSIRSVVCPADFNGMDQAALSCSANFELDDQGHPSPNVTGEPTIGGNILDDFCKFDRTYSDQTFDHCGNTYDILRTWTVIDWCTGQDTVCTQIIKIMDNDAPALTCPADITISASSVTCLGSTSLPASNPTDNCSTGSTTATYNGNVLSENANGTYAIADLPLGDHVITYTATDECMNTTSCTFTLTVEDTDNPVAICKTPTGGVTAGAMVPYTSINDGSYDACGSIVSYEVRRTSDCEGNATSWGEAVPFYCCDVGTPVTVELRVTDEEGLTNICSVLLTVQDNSGISISCPTGSPVAANCDNIDTHLASYLGVSAADSGVPAFYIDEAGDTTQVGFYQNNVNYNCSASVYISDSGTLTSCGEGTIVRNYKVVSGSGATTSCNYTYNVTNPAFVETTDVNWPSAEVETTCANISNVAGPTFNALGCDHLYAVPSDVVIPTPGFSYCFKIIRTYDVYDCCIATSPTLVATFTQLIKVTDDTAPVLSCGVSSNEVTVGGSLGFVVAADDCTDAYDGPSQVPAVTYAYSIDQDNDGTINLEGEGKLGVELTGPGTAFPVGMHTVTFTATDACGNTATCSVLVSVTGNLPPMSSVSGAIGNEDSGMLANVDVSPIAGMDMVTTDENGMFNMNLPTSENYNIKPLKDDDHLNGVSTYDIVLISKHLLGIETLDSPYKMIAADINKSGHISTLDMVLLRKMILFIDLEFTDNTSWRFVDANYVFNDPTEPFNELFPETYPINGLDSDMQGIDFVAVKTGDVNGTAEVNLNGAADDRTFEGELKLGIEEQQLKTGETYQIDIKAKDFNEILGYQFTLGFEQNAIEIMDVVSGDLPGMDAGNFNLQGTSEGVITTSWNQQNAVSLDDNTVLFTLEVNAKQDVKLSDVLNTNSRLTAAEAYRESANDIKLLNLAIEYTESTSSVDANAFALYQNRPNPFKEETLIAFSLPEKDEISLKIFDVSGKILTEIVGTFDKGYNELSVNRSDLNASGVLYYELSTSKHTALQKMIVID